MVHAFSFSFYKLCWGTMKLLSLLPKRWQRFKSWLMNLIDEAGELELIKIRSNFQYEHWYHKNGNYAHPYILDYIG